MCECKAVSILTRTMPRVVVCLNHTQPDIVDIKPANMEELTEVITAAQFHPTSCHMLIYSSSKGTIRLCDMREKALCDDHSKCECVWGEWGGREVGEGGRESGEGEREEEWGGRESMMDVTSCQLWLGESGV